MTKWTAFLTFHIPHATWDYKTITAASKNECLKQTHLTIATMTDRGWTLQDSSIKQEDTP